MAATDEIHSHSYGGPSGQRLKAAIAAGAIQVALVVGLVSGLAFDAVETVSDRIGAFDVPLVTPPPPPEPEATAEAPARDEGKAAPANLESKAKPRVAPTPKVPIPIKTADAAEVAGVGNAANAGASTVPGTGSGAGGVGFGTGSGDSGSGMGGGGGGRPAQRQSGRLSDRDYPAAAMRAGAAGTVFVRFTVQPNGRVTNCMVTQSSGSSLLDQTTCRLIEARFRYRPATDAAGQPISEQVSTNFTWGVRAR